MDSGDISDFESARPISPAPRKRKKFRHEDFVYSSELEDQDSGPSANKLPGSRRSLERPPAILFTLGELEEAGHRTEDEGQGSNPEAELQRQSEMRYTPTSHRSKSPDVTPMNRSVSLSSG